MKLMNIQRSQRSSAKHGVDGGLRHCVEEEDNHEDKEEEYQQFEQFPFEISPQDILESFTRVQKPQERRVRAAGRQRVEEVKG